MSTWYVSDLAFEYHITAPKVLRVLSVKLLAYREHGDMTVSCSLYGHESAQEFKWRPDKLSNSIYSILNQISVDLIQKTGKNGVLDWQNQFFPEQLLDFELSWKKTAFHNSLRAYDITKRLTFEQALRVLEEYYVVSPVMES